MSNSVEKASVRPLGLLEKLYTARHSLGLYNSISLLNSYRSQTSFSVQQLHVIVSVALAQVIPLHAALCHGIHGEDTRLPSFVPVERIDLTEKLVFRPAVSDGALLRQLEAEHDTPWTAQDTKPPWKLIVYYDEGQSSTAIDAAYITHHAVADGLSAAAFQSSLLQALQDVATQPNLPSMPVQDVAITQAPLLTPPVEDLVKFGLSWGYILGKALEEYGPRFLFGKKTYPFTGEPNCELSDQYPNQTKIRLLSVAPGVVKSLISQCKAKDVSVTILLSVILGRSLALALPSADAFIGTIPYSLRRVTGTDATKMVNQTSALEIDYQSDVLSTLRRLKLGANSDGSTEPVWSEARRGSVLLRDHLSDCLTNNLVGLLPYVSDHHEFYRKKLGQKREVTFDLSNIGVFPSKTAPSDTWNTERSIFAQGAAVVGAALNVNVASVRDGPMTITFSWQENVMDANVVAATVEMFKFTLDALV